MKKIIILGFFVLMFLSTYAVVYIATYFKMGNMEVSYETVTDKLTQTETEEYNRSNFFQKQLPIREGFRNVRVDEIKITRTKKGFGWETKVDTLKSYAIEEECGCN